MRALGRRWTRSLAARRRRRARCPRASGLEAAAASRRVGARGGRRGGRRTSGASRGAGAAHVRAAARGPAAFARGSRRSAADGHHPAGMGSRLRRAAGGAAAEARCAGARGKMDRALSAALRRRRAGRRRADRAASAAAVCVAAVCYRPPFATAARSVRAGVRGGRAAARGDAAARHAAAGGGERARALWRRRPRAAW